METASRHSQYMKQEDLLVPCAVGRHNAGTLSLGALLLQKISPCSPAQLTRPRQPFPELQEQPAHLGFPAEDREDGGVLPNQL